MTPDAIRSRSARFVTQWKYFCPTYWIVDPDARQVEVWTPTATAPHLDATRLAWHPAGATEPCVIELAALFA